MTLFNCDYLQNSIQFNAYVMSSNFINCFKIYAYCNSNPVMYSDPSGFVKQCDSKVGGEKDSNTGKNSVYIPKDAVAHTNPHQHVFNYDFDNRYWYRSDPEVF